MRPPRICLSCGDMNMHLASPIQSLTNQNLTTRSLHSLVQEINWPTHSCGHIIDWVIVRTDDDIHIKSTVADPFESDHYCTKSYLNVSVSKYLTYIGLLGTLLTLTANPLLLKFPVFRSFHLLKRKSCDYLLTVLDKHSPIFLRKVITHNASPWCESIRDELSLAKIESRHAER